MQGAEMDSGRSRGWAAVGWVFAVSATLLNGVVVGYGAIWFQIGNSGSAEDYAVSAGGYGAAAVVLAIAVLAFVTHRATRWLAWPTGTAAIVLGLLAARSADVFAHAEQRGTPMNTDWDGIGGVIWAPWTWALVALGVHGLYRLIWQAPRPDAPGTDPDGH